MEKYTDVLKNTKLFAGVGEEEIGTMLDCLGAALRQYKKGDYVYRAGEYVRSLTVLVEGCLHIQKDDYWGNRAILGDVAVGEMFGEAYVSPESGALLNDVVAVEDSVVLFFDIQRILTVCPSACKFHSLTVKNLFFAISEKNRKLVSKLGHISNRTTRESCFPISPMKRSAAEALPSPFPSTVSSLRIFCRLTAAPCPMSWGRCARRD